MTLHSHVKYRCSRCRTHFVPFPGHQECPKCGRKSRTGFIDFIQRTVESALFNLSKYGDFIPPAWGKFCIGDHYYWFAFRFLHFTSSSLAVAQEHLLQREFSERDARRLASQFLRKFDFGEHRYMANALRAYFIHLLCSPRVIKEIEQAEAKSSCFISHSSADKEFSGKLYADLVAFGVKCWYFPADATYGRKLWQEIDAGIRSSAKVVVICSASSLKSAPVLREIERALQREDSEAKDILLPVSIDNYALKNWTHHRAADVVSKVVGDFRQWRNITKYRESFARLLKSIKE